MCTLCYMPMARPRVVQVCVECRGLPTDTRCPACHGRGHISHEVSFECECDGCREFRGEPKLLRNEPVQVGGVFQ